MGLFSSDKKLKHDIENLKKENYELKLLAENQTNQIKAYTLM